MNTRKALKIMSRGKKQDAEYVAGPLAKFAAKFKAAYENKEADIVARQNQDVIIAPVFDALRNKLAVLASQQDSSMPVVMRFDAYQVVRHAAESTKREDRGLTQLARHLEKLWTEDPMGSLTLGDLNGLRSHYGDAFPKSRSAKVIETEIPKVGYSTLPVAKLARIAATIEDQADFDNAIALHGFNGDQMPQVRARTLIRELVAIKTAGVDARVAAGKDERSNFERITDKVGQMMDGPPVKKGPPMGPPMEDELDAPPGLEGLEMAEPLDDLMMDDALPPPPGEEGEMGDLVQVIEEVNQQGQELMPQFPGAEEYAEAEAAEGGGVPPTTEWAFSEGQETGPDGQPLHTAPPPSKEWQEEELDEHGKPGLEEGPPGEEEFALDGPPGAPKMGQRMMEIPQEVELLDEEFDDFHAPELPKAPREAPMQEREKTHLNVERHHTPRNPGSMPKDLQAPPTAPASPRHQERLNELGRETDRALGNRRGEKSGVEAVDGEGFPTDGHTEVTTYAPKPSANGGTELKKGSIGFTAAEIESALLDQGSVVKVGNVSISINDQNDEVELWVKDAGRACDLRYLDTAIQDFIRYASEERNPSPARKGGYMLTRLVPVPCGKCATVSRFQPTANQNDIYECECGHRTKAATVLSLVKHGTIAHEYKLDLQLPAKLTANVKQAKSAMSDTIKRLVTPIVPSARVESFDGSGATLHIAGASEAQIQKLTAKLRSVGVPRLAQMDPGVPGGADMPLAPEPTQPSAAPAAPPPADGAPQDKPNEYGVHQNDVDTDMIGAAFKHYKAMGMPFLEAIKTFTKDYSEAIENHWSPDMDAAVIAVAQELYTGGPAPQTPPEGAVGEGAPPAGPPQQAIAAARKILAQAKANMSPKVNQTQGPQVKGVGKKPLGPGKESEQGPDFKDPAVKKNHPAKQKSPTDMGKYQESDDPGRFKAPMPSQDSNKPKNKKLPATTHDKDSDTFGKGIPVPKITKTH